MRKSASAADLGNTSLPPYVPQINRWAVLVLAIVTVLAYIPALDAPFVMDDEATIDASSVWSAPPGFPTAGRPIVLASLAANYEVNRLLGVNQERDPGGPYKAVGYRMFNVLLHLLTAALLFGVLRRAMRETAIPEDWRAIADPIASTVCIIWLLHPIQSEVIDYIVQRSEAIASLFYLATLYASQRAWASGPPARLRWCVLAVAASVLGMLSKEVVITVPLIVMLYDRAFRLPTWRALFDPKQGRPWLYAALWIACLGTFAIFESGARGETAGFHTRMTWYQYFLTQCWAIPHYLGLVYWPAHLSVDYGAKAVDLQRAIPGLVLLSMLAIAAILGWTRAARFGALAFLASCFFIILAPSSSFVPQASEVAAERRMYLALAPVLMLTIVTAEWLRRRFAATVTRRSIVVGVGVVAIALAITTAERGRTYSSIETLWRSAAIAVPDNPRALGNLGLALARLPVPKLAEAESVFANAAAHDSTCDFGCLQYATVLARAGKPAAALPVLERAATIDPNDIPIQRALGLILMKLGDYGGAIPHLEPVVEQFPSMEHLVVLGVACLSAGHQEEAVSLFRRVAGADGGTPEMQQLSTKLENATHHPDALPDLQQFAWRLSSGWM